MRIKQAAFCVLVSVAFTATASGIELQQNVVPPGSAESGTGIVGGALRTPTPTGGPLTGGTLVIDLTAAECKKLGCEVVNSSFCPSVGGKTQHCLCPNGNTCINKK